jgi:hypothetical protein
MSNNNQLGTQPISAVIYKKLDTRLIYATTYEMTFHITNEQDDLITRLGNRIGGHDDILPRFLHEKIKTEFTDYLNQMLEINKNKRINKL